MLSLKKFFLLLIIVISLSTLYIGKNFIDYINTKNSEEYLSQINTLKNKINKEKRKIIKLKKTYKKNDNITTMEYYMNLVKQFKYIVKGASEISDFNIRFIKNNKYKVKKKNKNLNLLSSYLTTYKENKYIKALNLIISFKLNAKKDTNLNDNLINFFKLYKPLIYFYYLKKDKPIIVQNINYSNNLYNIYIKILGN